MSQQAITILIYIHALFGGISLITGTFAIATRKGGKRHKSSGKVFVITLAISALTAIFVSLLPNHDSPFLFSIGVLSLYFTLSGFRSISFKSGTDNLTLDKLLASALFVSSLYMLFYPIYKSGSIHLLFTIFGGLGIVFSIQDFLLFRNPSKLKEGWLKLHLGKISGAYISSFTAFIVVNQIIPGIWGWILPGVIGGMFIAYWMRKVSQNKIA